MKKTMFLGIALMTIGNSLMAMSFMPGISKNYSNLFGINNGKIATLSVEEVKIRNSGLKSGTIVSIGCEKNKQNGAIGAQISYGKMDYERGKGDVSYLRISTYKQCERNIATNTNAYVGLKAQINFIDGLNNKGIGFGPYAGIKYKTTNKIDAGIHVGIAKDWFEGGKFYTETSVGADLSYNF